MEKKTKSNYNGYTEARKKANAAWAQKQAQIAIRIPPEIKEKIDAHILAKGESIVRFIIRSTMEQIERDNAASNNQKNEKE